MQDDVQPPRPTATSSDFTNSPNTPNPPTDATPEKPAGVTEPAPVLEGKKHSHAKWIVFVILALILGALLGYFAGAQMKENELTDKYDAQVSSLQSKLDAAKKNVDDSVDAGKDAVEEGQDTLATLQKENEQLKATVAQQSAKIADLEKQLADAQKDSSTGTTN